MMQGRKYIQEVLRDTVIRTNRCQQTRPACQLNVYILPPGEEQRHILRSNRSVKLLQHRFNVQLPPFRSVGTFGILGGTG
jgi:hypothetical protein